MTGQPVTRWVLFYVEVPEGVAIENLRRARIAVPGWPDFGFRGEVDRIYTNPPQETEEGADS